MRAIGIIRNEHRSLAAVLDGMLYFVHQIRDRGAGPDFNLLGAMIYYIDTIPERFHHPKEEEYLFRFLRLRHPDAAALLDRLKSEHRDGAEKIRTLEQALTRYQQGGAAAFSNWRRRRSAWDQRARGTPRPDRAAEIAQGSALIVFHSCALNSRCIAAAPCVMHLQVAGLWIGEKSL